MVLTGWPVSRVLFAGTRGLNRNLEQRSLARVDGPHWVVVPASVASAAQNFEVVAQLLSEPRVGAVVDVPEFTLSVPEMLGECDGVREEQEQRGDNDAYWTAM